MRIYLIGYMGSGKTTIGRLVASNLGLEFCDMDDYIQNRTGKSVNQLFAEEGEEVFRLLEKEALRALSFKENVVISTGGGTPCFYDNMDFMLNNGLTIYFKLSAAELADRLLEIGLDSRPLLAGKTPQQLSDFIADALLIREPFYLQAAHAFSGSIVEVTAAVCSLITENQY